MGSFCCEKFGVDRFRTLTRAEIDARYQEFKSFTRVLSRNSRPERRGRAYWEYAADCAAAAC